MTSAFEKNKNRKLICRIFSCLLIASILLLGYIVFINIKGGAPELQKSKEKAENLSVEIAKKIEVRLKELMLVAESLSRDVSVGKLAPDDLVKRLQLAVENNQELFSACVAYEPFKYDSGKRLYAPCVIREGGEIDSVDMGEIYDYSLPGHEGELIDTRHHGALLNSDGWSDAFFDEERQRVFIDYGVPFYASGSDREKIGVINFRTSIDEVNNLIDKLRLGKTGYGFMISHNGSIISHPIKTYAGKNVQELAEVDKTIDTITRNISLDDIQKHHNGLTGQNYWVVYKKIGLTNWTLGVLFVEGEVYQDGKALRRLRILLVMSIIVFIFFVSVKLTSAYNGSSNSLCTVVSVFSVLCIAGILSVWYFALASPIDEDSKNATVLDKAGLEALLDNLLPPESDVKWGQMQESPTVIPTGVFVQSIEFTTTNNVLITGYVWQRLAPEISDKVSPGLIFPEAEEIEYEESYSYSVGDVTAWYFRASIRQLFDYDRYPFDREDIWIRLWPKDFYKNIILKPDFDSYHEIRPNAKPGLEEDAFIEGWEIYNTFFSYRVNSYNTNFGSGKTSDFNNMPELYFNIGLKRRFLNIFISDMIPMFVIAILLFIILMIKTNDKDKIDLLGFCSFNILDYCSALLFVLIVAHVYIREKLNSSGIIYIEYFYFVMYFVILLISASSILFVSKDKFSFIKYNDGFFLKLLYWPIVLGMVFGLTLIKFY